MLHKIKKKKSKLTDLNEVTELLLVSKATFSRYDDELAYGTKRIKVTELE